MSLLSISSVRERARKAVLHNFSSDRVLLEKIDKQKDITGFDIFLSHAFDDKELVLGIVLTLEDLGYKVYLDWRDDPSLQRSNINKETANQLRDRMKKSKCLFFAITQNSSNSKWMPWELGYMDGNKNRAAILPILENLNGDYKGQEYLSIYPYVIQQVSEDKEQKLWVCWSKNNYVLFEAWLRGHEPYPR